MYMNQYLIVPVHLKPYMASLAWLFGIKELKTVTYNRSPKFSKKLKWQQPYFVFHLYRTA